MLNVVVVRSSSSAPEAGGIWVLKAQIDVHPVSDSVLHFFSGLRGGEALCFFFFFFFPGVLVLAILRRSGMLQKLETKHHCKKKIETQTFLR